MTPPCSRRPRGNVGNDHRVRRRGDIHRVQTLVRAGTKGVTMPNRPTAAVVVENLAMRGIGDVNRRRAIEGLRLTPAPRVIGIAGDQARGARRDEPAFGLNEVINGVIDIMSPQPAAFYSRHYTLVRRFSSD